MRRQRFGVQRADSRGQPIRRLPSPPIAPETPGKGPDTPYPPKPKTETSAPLVLMPSSSMIAGVMFVTDTACRPGKRSLFSVAAARSVRFGWGVLGLAPPAAAFDAHPYSRNTTIRMTMRTLYTESFRENEQNNPLTLGWISR